VPPPPRIRRDFPFDVCYREQYGRLYGLLVTINALVEEETSGFDSNESLTDEIAALQRRVESIMEQVGFSIEHLRKFADFVDLVCGFALDRIAKG
jgi:hypothetical protein